MIAGGTLLGPYQILSRLGSGGMGEVYRAKDSRLGREVAIKVLPERFAQDKEALGRFEREARALAAISHPNILTIYDFGASDELTYVVMELLEGETLRTRIARGPLAWDKAVEIALEVAEGLSTAHARGVIHRDLKPENIFITKDGWVKILDFGLARIDAIPSQEDQDKLSTMWVGETKPGMIMGTIPYMSPEQVRGSVIDARSDIFSFGCVLYEMVTGHCPFNRNNIADTMAAILVERPLAKNSNELPPELWEVIMRCLEKDQEQRFQTARDLTFSLKILGSSSSISKSFIQREQSRKTQRLRKTIDSLAVLPFTNASADAHDAEYLSDGITESIINSLSQLPKLRVVPRSTVFRYKGREVDPLSVGRELNVRVVLTGRVVQRGDMLNIQAELVDVVQESQLWGEQFSRHLSDIFKVQEEISREISQKLRIKLSGEEKRRLTKRHTENSEAYQLYLRGRYFWNKRSAEGLRKGIEYFHQALEKDPGYALPYAGLADSYALVGYYGAMPPKEAMPKAKAAAMKALELDDTLAEAHTSLAMVKLKYDWDWPGAEGEFKRALDLNPGYATAHQWYGRYLQAMGRLEDALAETMKAQEIDPLSLIINNAVGYCYILMRDYHRAIEQFRKTLDMDPDFALTYFDLGFAYSQVGCHDEAIAAVRKAIGFSMSPELGTLFDQAYQSTGYHGALQSLIKGMIEVGKRRYVSSHLIAAIYAANGEQESAFEWLERAFVERSEGMAWLKVDPRLDSLRSDPRFQDLLVRVGLV